MTDLRTQFKEYTETLWKFSAELVTGETDLTKVTTLLVNNTSKNSIKLLTQVSPGIFHIFFRTEQVWKDFKEGTITYENDGTKLEGKILKFANNKERVQRKV